MPACGRHPNGTGWRSSRKMWLPSGGLTSFSWVWVWSGVGVGGDDIHDPVKFDLDAVRRNVVGEFAPEIVLSVFDRGRAADPAVGVVGGTDEARRQGSKGPAP